MFLVPKWWHLRHGPSHRQNSFQEKESIVCLHATVHSWYINLSLCLRHNLKYVFFFLIVFVFSLQKKKKICITQSTKHKVEITFCWMWCQIIQPGFQTSSPSRGGLIFFFFCNWAVASLFFFFGVATCCHLLLRWAGLIRTPPHAWVSPSNASQLRGFNFRLNQRDRGKGEWK